MSDPRREAVYQAILHPLLGLSGDGEWAAEAAHQAADAVLAALDATPTDETWEQVGVDIDGDWFSLEQVADGMPFARPPGTEMRGLFVRRPVPSATPAAEPFNPNQSTGWHGGGTADKEHNDAGV